jgi:hypothetical protein
MAGMMPQDVIKRHFAMFVGPNGMEVTVKVHLRKISHLILAYL